MATDGTALKKKTGCGTLVGLIIVIAIAVAIVSSLGGHSPSAKFTGTIEGISILDPAEVSVSVHVVNTSNVSGTPTCTVDVSSPGSAYTGFDSFTPKTPLAAGDDTTFNGDITVTNQGAQYVDAEDSTVKC